MKGFWGKWLLITSMIFSLGTVQTLSADGMIDTDGDGIIDRLDLDDDNDGILDTDEGLQSVIVNNPGFEEPTYSSAGVYYPSENDVPYWDTTATDNKIEIWRDGGGLGIDPDTGHQHAELNAFQTSALYQDIQTNPGDVILWYIAHRGRDSDTTPDVAEVKIGAPGGQLDTVATLSDTNTEWGHYTGVYVVPAGQTTTRFQFEAISTAGGDTKRGNFLDSFELMVVRDTDGDGIPDHLDLDSDNDGITDLAESSQDPRIVDQNGDGVVDSTTDNDNDGLMDTADADDNNPASGSTTTVADTDGDGNADPYDTDSDGDGCYDAVEGAGHFDASALDGNGSLTGGVESNGIPTAANGGTYATAAVTDSDNTAYCNTFVCQPAFYQVIDETYNELNVSDGNYIQIGTSADKYNSTGWDIRSNIVYGLGANGSSWANHLLVIGNDGVAHDMGIPIDANGNELSGDLYAADMDREGNLWVQIGVKLVKINVDTNTHETISFTNSSGTGYVRVADLVYERNTNSFWGARQSGDTYAYIFRWNLNDNKLTRVQVEGLPNSTMYGAAYTDNRGNLYFSDNGGIYRVDDYLTTSPTAVKVADSASTNSNDGASCPDAPPPFIADISLTKEVSPLAARAGDTVTFTLTLKNDGPNTATDVNVTDKLPDGYTYVSGSITGNDNGTGATITTDESGEPNLKWNVDVLGKDQNVTLSFQATVNESGDHNNTAEVTALDQFDPDSTPDNDEASEDDFDWAVIDFAPEASDDNLTALSGETLTTNVITDDNGDGNDTDPDGDTLTITGATIDTDGDGDEDNLTIGTPTQITDSSGAVIGTITLEEDGTLTFVPDSSYSGEVPPLTYTVSDGKGGTDTATVRLTVFAPFECKPAFYQVITKNLKELNVTDGSYTTIGSSADNYNAIGWDARTNLIYGIGRNSYESHLLVIDQSGVAYDLGLPTEVNTGAQYDGTPNAGDMKDNYLYVRDGTNLVRIDVDANTYEAVTFTDNSDGRAALVSDIVYIERTNSFWGGKDNKLYRWNLSDMTLTYYEGVAGLPDSGTVYGAAYTDNAGNLYLSNNDGGVYRVDNYDGSNPVAVKVSDSQSTNKNDGASCPNAPAPFYADLSLTKEVSPASVNAGDTVTFTLTLKNDGPNAATDINVTDVLPGGYSYVANSIAENNNSTGATITTDDSNAPTLVWNVSVLQKDQNVTLSFQATANGGGDHNNTAEITAVDQPDPDSVPNDHNASQDDFDWAQAEVTVTEVAKVECDDTVLPDHIIEYRLPAPDGWDPAVTREEDVDVGDQIRFSGLARINGRTVDAILEILEINSSESTDDDVVLKWRTSDEAAVIRVESNTDGNPDNSVKFKLSFVYADNGDPAPLNFMFTANDIDGDNPNTSTVERTEYIRFYHDEFTSIRWGDPHEIS